MEYVMKAALNTVRGVANLELRNQQQLWDFSESKSNDMFLYWWKDQEILAVKRHKYLQDGQCMSFTAINSLMKREFCLAPNNSKDLQGSF